ncbi:GNAT family N-acetyltransferase [Pseudonocardia sp. H11422]|uniref:GNAT family N-acetyltransferase n=1 Tax=Pseudonocardia sp. H11422 TaxID=2835866 RepID=UPI001BDBDB9B|nr:GNAT family N-acetyltransferase [Pseudonocardia sp. H11422]
MRLLLRCDAGGLTGVGHAVRSVALAEAATARGHEVRWCGRLDSLDWLRAGTVLDPTAVLGPEDDPARLAALARDVGADAVHVDHYGLSETLREVLDAADLVMSNLEDFGHGRRAADVVVDPNLGAERRTRPDDGSPTVLRGPGYALLRGAVRDARRLRAERAATGGPPRVLVVMGGTDAAGLLDPVVAALHAAGVAAEADVVVPPGRALRLPPDGPVRFRTGPPRADLPALMARADLVVSAAGTTVWELCCVGAPMALVRAADNQTDGYAAVVAARAAAGLGGPDDLRDVPATAAALRGLLADERAREDLASRARALVDGLGASRVVAALEDAVGTGPALRARPAGTGDTDLLLAWRNDATTRRWSRTSAPVAPDEHAAWLRRSLGRDDRLLLVVETRDRRPVGTVRWDRDDTGVWEVSVTVAPDQRGRGLAAPVLRCGEEALRDRSGPVPVRAVVHVDNAPSRRLFDSAGYAPAGAAGPHGFAPYRKVLR